MKLSVFVALAVIVSTTPVTAPLPMAVSPKPDLTVQSASIVQSCTGQNRGYTVTVMVANHGRAASSPRLDVPVVLVQDAAHPPLWSGSAGLPAVPVGATATVRVSLTPSQPGTALQPKIPLSVTLNSGHWIAESDYTNDTTAISGVQNAGCAPVSAVTLGVHSVPVRNGATTVQSATNYRLLPNPHPVFPTPVPVTHPQPMPANFIAPPTGLTYTTDPTVCVNHVGLLGAFVCEAAISQAGLLLLIWSWTPCHTVTCQNNIQGFHIYVAPAPLNPQKMMMLPHSVSNPANNVPQPSPANTGAQSGGINPFPGGAHFQPVHVQPRSPIDTQSDPSITMRGIAPYRKGECFVVTAFGYGHESDDSNTFCVGDAAFLTTPYGLHYQTAYDNHLMLEWYWTPCPASSGCVQNINGFNVYQTGGAFVRQQNDPTRPVADVGPFNVGSCYVVRAYSGNVQSDPSSPFCVTAQIVPTPTPQPGAPSHVDIDITDDSFPDNVVVKVGGSVTWKNDDTDEHDVTASDSSFYGDLPPGEKFTQTFPRTGAIVYYCHYHQPNMRGKITVVPY